MPLSGSYPEPSRNLAKTSPKPHAGSFFVCWDPTMLLENICSSVPKAQWNNIFLMRFLTSIIIINNKHCWHLLWSWMKIQLLQWNLSMAKSSAYPHLLGILQLACGMKRIVPHLETQKATNIRKPEIIIATISRFMKWDPVVYTIYELPSLHFFNHQEDSRLSKLSQHHFIFQNFIHSCYPSRSTDPSGESTLRCQDHVDHHSSTPHVGFAQYSSWRWPRWVNHGKHHDQQVHLMEWSFTLWYTFLSNEIW